MPFASVTELPADPDVRVFFTGLLILDPNPDPDPGPLLGSNVNACEVFINRSAPDHHLSIEVRRKRAGEPDLIMMRHLEDLSFGAAPPNTPPRYGMLVRVTGRDHPRGVRRYDPADPNAPSPEGRGFGFAIDLAGPQFHGGPLEIDRRAGRPSIVFNDAIFYTAATTRGDAAISLLRENTVIVERLPPFASIFGANIYLDADDPNAEVEISWRQQGLDKILRLRKPPAGESFEIYIANEPLYEQDSSPFAAHDEFAEYYRLLPNVPVQERFRLVVPPPQPGAPPTTDRGSTTTPCMPVVIGGGSG